MATMYYVYILKSSYNGSYYKGHTKDLKIRLHRHNGKMEKSTARYAPWELIWFTEKETKAEAMILEKKLKNLSVFRLESFMQKYKE